VVYGGKVLVWRGKSVHELTHLKIVLLGPLVYRGITTDALRFDRLLGFAHASLMSYTVVALQWLPGSFLFSR
jgi:hypothetical protein